MNTLKITLKQHTPLIHFQHDQEGATLRASEVKPKLDKFILTMLGKGSYTMGCEIAQRKSWLIADRKREHYSLNYKMSITCSDTRTEYLIASGLSGRIDRVGNVIILPCTPYFAQEKANLTAEEEDDGVIFKQGKGQEATKTFRPDCWDKIDKKGLMWEYLEIRIFSLKADLIENIESACPSFFICTNFGTRSNKGFGSFTVSKINGSPFKSQAFDLVEASLKRTYAFVYKKDIYEKDLSKIFQDIKEDYQKIKSGINFKGKYIKSLLFCYAVEEMSNHPRWEKRQIKQIINASSLSPFVLKTDKLRKNTCPIYGVKENEQAWNDPTKFSYQFLRTVLGLAEQYEFLLSRIDTKTKEIQNTNSKIIVKITSQEENKIERFQSPLLFKVIEGTIYIVGNEIDEGIMNKHFEFKYSKKVNNKPPFPLIIKDASVDHLNHLSYHFTPKKEDFSLLKFMKFAIRYKDAHGALVLKNYKTIKE